MRKMQLAMRVNALVVFPGGFGALDEVFEIPTLRQVGKAPPIPVILVDRAFGTAAVGFDVLVTEGFVTGRTCSPSETAQEAWDALLARSLAPDRPVGSRPGA